MDADTYAHTHTQTFAHKHSHMNRANILQLPDIIVGDIRSFFPFAGTPVALCVAEARCHGDEGGHQCQEGRHDVP